MTHGRKRQKPNLSIIQAVETLSSIADIDYDHDVGITQQNDLIIQDQPITYKTVHWLDEQDADTTVAVIKETFRVILRYLRNFYKKEYREVKNEKAIEGIKTIMVLVGEAAKKLDKYTNLFQKATGKSVTSLQEYKRLQDFYLTRIARKIDEGTLGRWILGLTKGTLKRKRDVTFKGRATTATRHVFVDLESVKKDTEYELFSLRKEDGTRFFNPRLIRNIKLVCDFGEYFGNRPGGDPLTNVNVWQDEVLHRSAIDIYKALRSPLQWFFAEQSHEKNQELVGILHKAFLALMLSGNSRNLSSNKPIKNCAEYFGDFQNYLRRALQTRDYQKLIAYPPKRSDHFACRLLDLVNNTCRALFMDVTGNQEAIKKIHDLLEEAYQEHSPEHLEETKRTHQVWNRLAGDYMALVKLLKRHPSGPLAKILDNLEQGTHQVFDPLFQDNIPNRLFFCRVGKWDLEHIRHPAPIRQEYIHKASITEEFKAFLRALGKKKFLIINLQDRTSWREYFRSQVIEELQHQPEFEKHLTVVTLPKDTEFYHQLPPYHEENHANIFMAQFREHLEDENVGFYFPKSIKDQLFPTFVDGVMKEIHQVFFEGKNVLSRENRLSFIEIFYLFLELKLIEIVKPSVFSLSCKDGIDVGSSATAGVFVFLKLLNQNILTEADWDQLDLILFGPSLLVRERAMLQERFNRLTSTLKTIEATLREKGANSIKKTFQPYFKSPVLKATITTPKPF